jgi:hypothetical protein
VESQHPIPQEISSYQFRLVGDMTITQFMEVAAGALVSLLFYSSGLVPYVKWPLIIVSFLIGIALAFFPLEDRPLSKWIVLFAKAIYSPTIYVWNKKAVRHSFFQPEVADNPLSPLPVDISSAPPQNKPGSDVSLTSSEIKEEADKLNANENAFLSKIGVQFLAPAFSTTSKQAPVSAVQVQAHVQPKQEVVVPKKEEIKIEVQKKPEVIFESSTQQAPSSKPGNLSDFTRMAGQNFQNAKSAVFSFSEEASPPSPPTRPNVIVGQVLDPNGKIIDSAILEIKDEAGRSVRALRSNRLGHFMIVTPLADGKYEIVTEKDGFIFDTVTFEAEDRIIPPIAIWAKPNGS